MNNPCDKPAQPYTADSHTDWDCTTTGPGTARPVGWARPPVDPGHIFWMVYVDGCQSPVKKHFEYKNVVGEAERLAQKDPGRAVYILRAEQYCLVIQPPVVWHECKAKESPQG